ncbi:MAG: L,D-transpeptidase family protein [Chloroflexota bacterium]
MRRMARWLIGLTVLLGFVLAACGGGSSAAAAGSPAPSAKGQSLIGQSAAGSALAKGQAVTRGSVAGDGHPAVAASPTPLPTATATPVPTPTPVPLTMSRPRFSLFTVNPQFTAQQVSFTLSRGATVRIAILPAGKSHPVRTLDLGTQPAGTVKAAWHGHDDAGKLVPAGSYSYVVSAATTDGVKASQSANDLGITYKKMVISLSQQRLTAFDGTKQFLTTLVTTGNPALPTPPGVYPILGKYHPFTFVSPWPKGSKFYYAPSPVQYALLFDDAGYYVHDAPWRGVFGPGSNTHVGTPGTDYTGSHGCVNVPLPAETSLYKWATIGTIVQVVP